MLDWLIVPIDFFVKWFNETIYQFFVSAFAYLVEQMTLASIKFTIWSSQFAWDIAKTIINDLGVTDALNTAWSSLDGDIISILSFFQIPDVVNILLTAFVTSYTLKFIPFSGK